MALREKLREETEREVVHATRGNTADAVWVGWERSCQLAKCDLILIQRGNVSQRNEEISCELVSTAAKNNNSWDSFTLSIDTDWVCVEHGYVFCI